MGTLAGSWILYYIVKSYGRNRMTDEKLKKPSKETFGKNL